jgi:hypothetical protein
MSKRRLVRWVLGAIAGLALLTGGAIVAAAPAQARVVIGFGFGPWGGYPYAYYPYPYYAYPAYPYGYSYGYSYPSYAYYGYPYYRPRVRHHHRYHHVRTTKSTGSACHPAPRACS